MGWDGKERRQHLRLSDDEKREIANEIRSVFEQQVGRGTLKAFGRICWTLCAASAGYVAAHLEKWIK